MEMQEFGAKMEVCEFGKCARPPNERIEFPALAIRDSDEIGDVRGTGADSAASLPSTRPMKGKQRPIKGTAHENRSTAYERE